MRCAAVVLAAGKGKRMNSDVQKQYLELKGFPVLYYSLKEMEDCPWMNEIVLVTGASEIDYCRREIVDAYGFHKVTHIVAGGKERYHSVYEGLRVLRDIDYVFIHDGARPFLDQGILDRGLDCVQSCEACAAGMPSKDTVKIVDANSIVQMTPNRSFVWQVQTPQVFALELVRTAYEKALAGDCTGITDDAMVVEQYGNHPVKLYEGSYENLKITTPEDLPVADIFLAMKN